MKTTVFGISGKEITIFLAYFTRRKKTQVYRLMGAERFSFCHLFILQKSLTFISQCNIITISQCNVSHRNLRGCKMDQHIKKVYVPMTETAFFILLCLRKPNHGYGIVQMVEKMTDGAIRLTPGTMYGLSLIHI